MPTRTAAILARFSAVLLPMLVWASPADAARPNVVLILIDDLGLYGVTAYGADRLSEQSGRFRDQAFSTPRIDQIASKGLRCDNAFVYPLCEATRVALMTGQYNSRNFVRPKSLHASQITFGDVFKRAGYATGMFGKWKQTRGTREIPAKDYIYEFGWDEFGCFDVVGEEQRYINPTLVINGQVHDYTGRSDVDPQTGRRWYGPDICNRLAVDFIDEHQDEPFFLYYPMLLVHDEHKPTPDTEPHSVFDNFTQQKRNRDGVVGDDRRYFPDMLAYADKLIGNVVDKLQACGLRENTLIVVMGDNGTKEPFTHVLPDGTQYPGGKGGNKDNGLHVPLVLSYPGVIPSAPDGTRYRSYAGLIDVTDIYPTLCEAAGIAIDDPGAIDGVSFWPQATGAAGEPRRHIYTWYNANNEWSDPSIVMEYAFNKRFKRYAPHANFPTGRFFDLRTDPLETAGDRQVKVAWAHVHRSGLDRAELDAEQKGAFDELQAIIDANAYVPVAGLKISSGGFSTAPGETRRLQCRVTPPSATRRNVIWESDDPAVASINKFGELTPHKPGSARISVYSWDDAYPLAARSAQAFSRQGVSNSIRVTVANGQGKPSLPAAGAQTER
ncbi:Choline-sulfatase [Pirellulimonas nuda]|uniref:Choline-sulfatase n=1 Tax=Pirellulimonas nuda TaxID=2528009 RepID=A0A518DCJ5_9BACT|nr:sulfatase-like hydrolase/transferase [Pirellulimonas nuda]QDU89195.1 Choline-sulfatase [Pirellulimonas nuda]